jgi:hypothetical protein
MTHGCENPLAAAKSLTIRTKSTVIGGRNFDALRIHDSDLL